MPETPYPYLTTDFLTAPAGAENVLPANPADPAPHDPAKSEGAFRLAVLTLLTEIRDSLRSAEAL